ncbi:aspartic proteinase nepenthesin-1 [Dendrobium catenatum]|uniref:Aspartic proteinase nepenthesin-1 n=1 Tax=Dendrobium catenatum TaxID=906689 RepID=A0A2I0WGB3_9ASPA|nr:aspartic proteinase nepenthesin-1 [Dendrobium catenatum]PKU74706.1 Aspartic proteinase nepenthesin-1 [Dendrobium catenatum]
MRPSYCLLHFTFLTIFLLTSLPPPSSSNELSLRLELTHIDAGLNLTVHELLRRAAARSKTRMAQLARFAHIRKGGQGQAPVFWGRAGGYEGEYLINFGVGTPPRNLPFIVDTGSTLVWTQCKPCRKCTSQPVPLFDPKKSSSFSKLSCSSKQCAALGSAYSSQCSANPECHFDYSYADGSETIGYIASEKVTFHYSSEPPLSVPQFAIGCARINQGTMASSAGTAGFGRSAESLVSQLGITRFSYCFIPYIPINAKRSRMFLGNAALSSSRAQSTPLLPDDIFYYVSLEGITVGSNRLPFGPGYFGRKKDGSGGTIFDSGTFNTILWTEVFNAVKKAFVSVIKLPVSENTLGADYQLCFDTPRKRFSPESVKIPKLVLHFKGADMDLPRENYVVYDANEKLLCVLIEEETDQSATNIIGNFYQQNMNVLYDLKNQRLSFGPAQCDRL